MIFVDKKGLRVASRELVPWAKMATVLRHRLGIRGPYFWGKPSYFRPALTLETKALRRLKTAPKSRKKKPRNEHLENSMTAFSNRSSAGNQGAKAPKNGAKKEPVREFHVTEKWSHFRIILEADSRALRRLKTAPKPRQKSQGANGRTHTHGHTENSISPKRASKTALRQSVSD